MDLDLKDKVAIVTGASSGIGFAIAEGLAAEGARVVMVGRSAKRLDSASAAIKGTTIPCVLDVTDEDAGAVAASAALQAFERIDILVNSAGIWRPGALFDSDCLGILDQHINVNLRAPLGMMIGVASHMKAQGSGSIVNIASLAGVRGFPGSSGYAASKAGLIMLSQSLAVELAGYGIRVNVIAPGNVETPMNAVVRLPENRHVYEQLERLTPSGRVYSRPHEIASAAIWFASPLSRPAVGSVLVLDEGVGAGLPSLSDQA